MKTIFFDGSFDGHPKWKGVNSVQVFAIAAKWHYAADERRTEKVKNSQVHRTKTGSVAENLSTKRCHVNSPKKVTVSYALCRCMHTAHKYNKSRESYGALHPVSDTADWWGWQGECGRGCWIDSGRWRRGHRLALLGVMTLTQCSAMASSSPLSLPLLRPSFSSLLWRSFSRRRRRRGGKDFVFEGSRLKGLEGVSA